MVIVMVIVGHGCKQWCDDDVWTQAKKMKRQDILLIMVGHGNGNCHGNWKLLVMVANNGLMIMLGTSKENEEARQHLMDLPRHRL